jgi:hypothetical protein
MSNAAKTLEPRNQAIDNPITRERLAWSIDAMMKAKARSLGVIPYPHLIDSIVLKANEQLAAGRDVLSVFFAARDEAEILLSRQENAENIIDQLLGLIRQTADQNPMAQHQAI